MHRRKTPALILAGAIAVAMTLFTGTAAQGDPEEPSPTDPQPAAVAPAAGEATTNAVPFSAPVPFTDAVAAAQSYPGEVLAIAYDNPESRGSTRLRPALQ